MLEWGIEENESKPFVRTKYSWQDQQILPGAPLHPQIGTSPGLPAGMQGQFWPQCQPEIAYWLGPMTLGKN